MTTTTFIESGEAFRRLGGLESPAVQEPYDVVVIGGGQAGLSVGYYLRKRGLRFVILDASPRIGDVWRMVARTAYTQLRHSPLLVLGTVLGMALLYLVPPLALVLCPFAGAWTAAAMGAAAFSLMLFAYRPTWELYRGDDPALVLLPLAGLLYTAMTVDSAFRHLRGKGGAWKGRTYAKPAKPPRSVS